MLSAYSTISVQDTALFLGMDEDDATNCKFLCYSSFSCSKTRLDLMHLDDYLKMSISFIVL